MRTVKVRFSNGRGVVLAGSLDLPRESAPRAYAVFAHCFTCNRNYKFIRHVSRALAQRGLAVLRLDFTGLGESEGRFEDTNFGTNVDDVLAAARFLEMEYGAPPRLLIGHSLGGTAVLAAAPRLDPVRAVATINAPSAPAHVLDRLGEIDAWIAGRGQAEVEIGGLRYRITPQLVADLRGARVEAAIGALGAALLVLHATHDQTADIGHAERIFAAARHPKSLAALPGADHLLSREEDAHYAAGLISAWSSIYLDAEPSRSAAAGAAP